MVQANNASEMGRRNGGAMQSGQGSERLLLMNLLARLRALDADVYVGHNISAFDLDVLLHRLQHHKVPPPKHPQTCPTHASRRSARTASCATKQPQTRPRRVLGMR